MTDPQYVVTAHSITNGSLMNIPVSKILNQSINTPSNMEDKYIGKEYIEVYDVVVTNGVTMISNTRGLMSTTLRLSTKIPLTNINVRVFPGATGVRLVNESTLPMTYSLNVDKGDGNTVNYKYSGMCFSDAVIVSFDYPIDVFIADLSIASSGTTVYMTGNIGIRQSSSTVQEYMVDVPVLNVSKDFDDKSIIINNKGLSVPTQLVIDPTFINGSVSISTSLNGQNFTVFNGTGLPIQYSVLLVNSFTTEMFDGRLNGGIIPGLSGSGISGSQIEMNISPHYNDSTIDYLILTAESTQTPFITTINGLIPVTTGTTIPITDVSKGVYYSTNTASPTVLEFSNINSSVIINSIISVDTNGNTLSLRNGFSNLPVFVKIINNTGTVLYEDIIDPVTTVPFLPSADGTISLYVSYSSLGVGVLGLYVPDTAMPTSNVTDSLNVNLTSSMDNTHLAIMNQSEFNQTIINLDSSLAGNNTDVILSAVTNNQTIILVNNTGQVVNVNITGIGQFTMNTTGGSVAFAIIGVQLLVANINISPTLSITGTATVFKQQLFDGSTLNLSLFNEEEDIRVQNSTDSQVTVLLKIPITGGNTYSLNIIDGSQLQLFNNTTYTYVVTLNGQPVPNVSPNNTLVLSVAELAFIQTSAPVGSIVNVDIDLI